MTKSTESALLLSSGNRAQIIRRPLGRRRELPPPFEKAEWFVEKRLLGFADVAEERQALYREAVIQRAARGRGVVPIINSELSAFTTLDEVDEVDCELGAVERGYVDGLSLKKICKEHVSLLSRKTCLTWMASLSATVARVHASVGVSGGRLGIVHRDVTPGNVLIEKESLVNPSRDDGVWLNDFGLAHVTSWGPLPPDETLQGTPRFLSPELHRGEQPNETSDVFQLALLLAMLLSCGAGEELPKSRSQFQDAARVLLARKLQTALASNPKERPTAAEFASLVEH